MYYFLKGKLKILIVKLKFRNASVSFDSNISMDTHLAEFTKVLSGTKIGASEIGRYTYVGINCNIERAKIGAFCSFGPEVICGSASHPLNFISTYPGFYTKEAQGAEFFGYEHAFIDKKEVVIGADVWIGTRAIILGGIEIGVGAVVAAGSVVTKSVPPYAIVGGVPAKVIKYRFSDETIEKLLASKWWETDIRTIKGNARFATDPLLFISNL
jgi:acetyltransferase-like isoleucine patch superfamily enzyme